MSAGCCDALAQERGWSQEKKTWPEPEDHGCPQPLRIPSKGLIYSRLQKVGTWTKDVLCLVAFFLWFGVLGRSCSNLLEPTVVVTWDPV